MTRIAILHYAGPPTIGGVESTIAHHAQALLDQGYAVRLIAGNQLTSDDPRLELRSDPLFGSSHPDILQVKVELDHGEVTENFYALVQRIESTLTTVLADCEVCIAHNVHTLHKNLALTAALANIGARGKVRLISWAHDLAWTNPRYTSELRDGYPYDLLRQAWPSTKYVTISDMRQEELSDLLDLPAEQIPIIHGGIDPPTFLKWTPTMRMLESRLHLLDTDGVLLLPARLTRRKNIEFGLRVLAQLRQLSQCDYRLVVTGPPGPHNPSNQRYLDDLLVLRNELGITDTAHFIYAMSDTAEPLLLDDDTLANLYQVCDALIFPSEQEGFGIPILEAALVRMPVFCSDIPPLRETGQDDVYAFDLTAEPRTVAQSILNHLTNETAPRLLVRIRHQFRWDVIVRTQLVPLLEPHGE
jgi:mannosylglucosylglycerate synthase